MNGKKLYPSKFVKYLGILIDSQLNFSYHINSISNKLGRAIGMLAKIRHYFTKDTLRSIYFGIFSSVLIYGSQNPSLCYKRHTSFNIFWYILICTYLRFTKSVTMLQKTHFVQYILVYSHLYLFTVHKIRHYVTKDTLRSIYFGIFSSVLIYGSQNPSLGYKRHTSFNIFWYILICTYLRFTKRSKKRHTLKFNIFWYILLYFI